MSNFKGTNGNWEFRPPSARFDAHTVCDGKVIGYASSNTSEDIANERLRASALELLEALERVMKLEQLISYPDNIKTELQGEAEAIRAMYNQCREAINKALGQ